MFITKNMIPIYLASNFFHSSSPTSPIMTLTLIVHPKPKQNPKLTLVHVCFVLYVAFNVLAEPFIEPQVRVEQGRHDEVKESPQLCHAVLDGSS